MNDLDKFNKVNNCESIDELCDTIISFADAQGMIQGRTKRFVAQEMANYCKTYWMNSHNQPRFMTREFGIRQQAMYLKYSEHSCFENILHAKNIQ